MSAVSPASSKVTPPRQRWSIARRLLLSPRLSSKFSKKERAGWTVAWAAYVVCLLGASVSVLTFDFGALSHPYGVAWAILGVFSLGVVFLGPELVFVACDHHYPLAYFVYRVFEEIDPGAPENVSRLERASARWGYADWVASAERGWERGSPRDRQSHVREAERRMRSAISKLAPGLARDVRKACATPTTTPERDGRRKSGSRLN